MQYWYSEYIWSRSLCLSAIQQASSMRGAVLFEDLWGFQRANSDPTMLAKYLWKKCSGLRIRCMQTMQNSNEVLSMEEILRQVQGKQPHKTGTLWQSNDVRYVIICDIGKKERKNRNHLKRTVVQPKCPRFVLCHAWPAQMFSSWTGIVPPGLKTYSSMTAQWQLTAQQGSPPPLQHSRVFQSRHGSNMFEWDSSAETLDHYSLLITSHNVWI
jgi:hypothetical protein